MEKAKQVAEKDKGKAKNFLKYALMSTKSI